MDDGTAGLGHQRSGGGGEPLSHANVNSFEWDLDERPPQMSSPKMSDYNGGMRSLLADIDCR